ncbi:hypothetical protein RRG08_000560 [Elysia crispata]|uniref:Cytochrome P450 n=1 Tax=Elysia crispata TaxID=231223 RepID=A0AAE1CU60_9GAST|nr:hypothetical protein RRG08_000560 [Elysia crispata]
MTCSLQEIFPQMAHVTLYQQRTFLKTDSPLTQTVSRISSSSSTPSASASSPSTAQSTSSEDGASPLPFSAIPGPRGVAQWPVLGAVMLFKPFTKFTPATAHQMLDNLFEQYGSIVRCQLKGTMVLVRDIKDVETVFRNEGVYPVRPSLQLPIQFAKRNRVKDGFNEVQGEKWHKLRAPLAKRLARVNSATYYMRDQNAVADDFRDILESGEHMTPEEMSDIFFRFTAESIGVVCFNTRLGFLDADLSNRPGAVEYLKASKALFRLLHDEIRGHSILHGLYRNKTYRNFEKTQLTLRQYSGQELQKAGNLLKQRQQSGTFDPEEPNLLFSLLSDPNLDFEDIRNLMNTLYVAGTDSTAKSLQVFFYNLATNLEKQENLYKEIIEVIGPDQALTPEALARMPYLKAAMKESFRMMFPNMGISRFMPKDVVLSGYLVPAGTQILICSISVSKAYFDNPHQYIPERWLRSEDGKRLDSTIHPMAALPFGYGPRNCIGRRFAEQEMYIATVKILQKLKIGVKPESEGMRFTYSVFVEPEKPIAFTFSKR